MKSRSLMFVASTLMCALGAAHASSLTVAVGDGIKPGEQVLVAVYDQEAQWLQKSHRAIRQEAPADMPADGTHTLSIDALAPGRYAVVAYVDRNGNGKLDRGMFGRPTEPYGFSNGGGSFGAPDFADAAFDVAEAGSAIRIDLN